MDLWSNFLDLPRPSSETAYTIGRGSGPVRIARSAANHPSLVITASGYGLAPRRLANLTFIPPREMMVTRADGRSERTHIAVIECVADDPELERYFCRAVGAFFASVGQSTTAPSSEEIERALDGITALFRALDGAPRMSVQGLWAELAMIAWARSPDAAISAWHSSPTDLHDFALGPHRLEVKATQSKLREHHFRLDQLNSGRIGATVIASLMLRPTSHGLGVFDLVEHVERCISNGAAARLEAIVAHTLGRDWRDVDAGDVRFDLDETKRTLRLFRAEDIPTVPLPLPLGIKHVEFVADLSTARELPFEQALAIAPLYADLCPRYE